MSYTETIIFIIEIVGTIAFASSGAMIAVKKNMDIFGVNVLGITTAVGGGMLRDILLGIHPPMIFQKPVYVIIAIATSSLLFLAHYMFKKSGAVPLISTYERIMIMFDTIGLAAFTAIGINTAINYIEEPTVFLLIFMGAITGIGGGMLRDIMAGMTPFVLIKHVYALASIAGGLVCILLRNWTNDAIALTGGAAVVIIIRYLAIRYHWNLPKVNRDTELHN